MIQMKHQKNDIRTKDQQFFRHFFLLEYEFFLSLCALKLYLHFSHHSDALRSNGKVRETVSLLCGRKTATLTHWQNWQYVNISQHLGRKQPA